LEKAVKGDRIHEDGYDLLNPLRKRIQFGNIKARVRKIRGTEPFTYTARDVEDGETVICRMLGIRAQVDLR
jgi:hypothetical protein